MAVAVLRPRTRGRDIALYLVQMWGFVMAHELPYDDPEALRARLRVRYPIVIDRALGLGKLPNARLQRRFSRPGRVTALDRVLSVVHWVWFMEPHGALLFVQARHPDRFPRAARQLAATYDLGCALYFAIPTAPPWWAAEQGYIDQRSSASPPRSPRPRRSRSGGSWSTPASRYGARRGSRYMTASTATRGRRCRRFTSRPR